MPWGSVREAMEKIEKDNRRKIIVKCCKECPYLDYSKEIRDDGLSSVSHFCRHLKIFGTIINKDDLEKIHEKCQLEYVRPIYRDSPYRPKKE